MWLYSQYSKIKTAKISNKKLKIGAGEVAQQLRGLALAEDPGSIASHPHGGSQTSVTPVPRDLMPSGFHGRRHIHGKHTYMQAEYSNT